MASGFTTLILLSTNTNIVALYRVSNCGLGRGYKEDIRGLERSETQPGYLPLLLNDVRLCDSPSSCTVGFWIQDLRLANRLRCTRWFSSFS